MAVNCRAVLSGICAVALSLSVTSSAYADSEHSSLPRLRFTNVLVDALIERGKRAPTFNTLLDRIQHSDVLVLIELNECHGRGTAVTEFITAAGGFRYVRIRLDIRTVGDAEVALLGHELQHVTELIDAPSVRDPEAYRALYEAIGRRSLSHHGWSFETRAAREAGGSVFAELRGRRVAGTPSE